MNGTVVSIDPDSGRILAMVNQKLALSAGAQPCSTIKVAVALGRAERKRHYQGHRDSIGQVLPDGPHDCTGTFQQCVFRGGRAEARIRKVSYYARQYGLGELAGWQIHGEHLGTFPSTVLDSRLGGVGKMCSFGESISLTPLQLGALMASIANGGTLYYLQHPTSPDDIANFTPKVKRQLDIGTAIPEMTDGLSGAVEYGTARHLRNSFIEEPVLGKDRHLLEKRHALWLVCFLR